VTTPIHADTTIPFVTVTNWLRSATVCGFNIAPLLREAGVDIDHLHPEQATITISGMTLLMQRCVDAARAQDAQLHFPRVLGESYAFDYLSDIETFITTSPTLRAAAPALQWLTPLVNPFMAFTIQEHGTQARLVLHFTHPEATPEDTWHFAESVFVTVCKFVRLLVGEALWRGEVSFQHQPHPGSESLSKALNLPVRFGADINALWFDRALLDHALRGALPALHSAAAVRVQLHLAQRTGTPAADDPAHGLAAQIESRLRRHPTLLGDSIDALAAELGLHPRTLQRRLREEGEQWSGIVGRVRQHLACEWLNSTALSVEDISERLGFADRRSFTQAFTRWTGQTPSDFRRQGNP